MKEYKKVEMVAKNAPSGSYAAGCPADQRGNDTGWSSNTGGPTGCTNCERTK